MNTPYFSIVIPTYNRGVELMSNVESILIQSFHNFEIIIVDDGSQDNTEQLISQVGQTRIKYFKTENRERAHARNFGLKHARGLYINYFDSDDIMYPDRLQNVFNWIRNNHTPDVLFTHYDFVDIQGNIVGQTERFYESFTKDILFNNFLACGSVFLKREIATQYLFHEDRKIITAEDWELWLRLHIHYEFLECPLKTFAIRQHGGRSLETILAEKVKVRDLYFVKLIKQNSEFRLKYGNATNLFVADRYTFIALTLAQNFSRLNSITYLIASFFSSVQVIRRRRFWGVIKTLLWPRKKGY